MYRFVRSLVLPAVLLVATACQIDGPRAEEPGFAISANRFDAAAARPGLEVAGFTIVAEDLRPAGHDDVLVGYVRFTGETTVAGVPVRMDVGGDSVCFFVDDDSAGRLPRMRHDDRRAWFCFENEDEARPHLEPLLGRTATLRIADYRTVYEFTDAYDTARFVALLAAASQ